MSATPLELAGELLSRPVLKLGGAFVTVGGMLAALVFVVGVWWFASLLERSVHRLSVRFAEEPATSARIHMFSRLLRYTVWVIGTLLGLNYFGIDLTNIALLGSAFAVGLGFGLQNVFSNFVSGVIILLERSLKAGDFVELESGVRGHVREVAMRYTRVTSNDALDVLVPNSEFINGRVVNWTLDDSYRRMHIPFGVAYGTPKELVREAGVAAARGVAGVIENERMRSEVWLIGYGDSAMNYELVVWADRALTTTPARSHAALMWALDDALKARGIEIPFPQRDLHICSGTLDVNLGESVRQSPPAPQGAGGEAGPDGGNLDGGAK